MGINLSAYTGVQQATFVRMVLTVKNPVTGVLETYVVRMSSHDVPFTLTEFDGVAYQYEPVGALLQVSGVDADIKAKQNDVTITLSCIDNQYMNDILNNPTKGAPVEIRRVFFNIQTGQFLDIPGNPSMEFSGVVSNLNFAEDWDENGGQSVTSTATLTCSSFLSVLQNKVSGRRTNESDQKSWFPGDNALNRVAVVSLGVQYLGGDTPSTQAVAPVGRTVTIA
jgi:hypothetical protein